MAAAVVLESGIQEWLELRVTDSVGIPAASHPVPLLRVIGIVLPALDPEGIQAAQARPGLAPLDRRAQGSVSVCRKGESKNGDVPPGANLKALNAT